MYSEKVTKPDEISKLYLKLLRGHSITTYFDKIRGGGGQKCLFLSTRNVKKLSMQGGGGAKNGKIQSS